MLGCAQPVQGSARPQQPHGWAVQPQLRLYLQRAKVGAWPPALARASPASPGLDVTRAGGFAPAGGSSGTVRTAELLLRGGELRRHRLSLGGVQ